MPNDPDDDEESINQAYAAVELACQKGFQGDYLQVYFEPSEHCVRFYNGMTDIEQTLEYAKENNIRIVVYPYVYFPIEWFLTIRKYYPGVNVIASSCSNDSHIYCTIFNDIECFLRISADTFAGQDSNQFGYNIDFFISQFYAPMFDDFDYTIFTSPGFVAGLIARLMYQFDLTFWEARVACICSSSLAPPNINIENYTDHFDEEDGYGSLLTDITIDFVKSPNFFTVPEPFLLYKLRSIDMTEQPVLITSVLMPAEIGKNLFIGLDGALCGNGAKALGVLNADSVTDEYAPVAVNGIALVLSGAAVTQGSKVQSNAAGKAITYSSGESNGYALDASTGADQLIRIRLS